MKGIWKWLLVHLTVNVDAEGDRNFIFGGNSQSCPIFPPEKSKVKVSLRTEFLNRLKSVAEMLHVGFINMNVGFSLNMATQQTSCLDFQNV